LDENIRVCRSISGIGDHGLPSWLMFRAFAACRSHRAADPMDRRADHLGDHGGRFGLSTVFHRARLKWIFGTNLQAFRPVVNDADG